MRYTFDFNQSNDTVIVNSYANQNILFESVTFNIKQLPEHCKDSVYFFKKQIFFKKKYRPNQLRLFINI